MGPLCHPWAMLGGGPSTGNSTVRNGHVRHAVANRWVLGPGLVFGVQPLKTDYGCKMNAHKLEMPLTKQDRWVAPFGTYILDNRIRTSLLGVRACLARLHCGTGEKTGSSIHLIRIRIPACRRSGPSESVGSTRYRAQLPHRANRVVRYSPYQGTDRTGCSRGRYWCRRMLVR